MEHEPGALWREVARRTNGDDYAHRYAERFDALAESGQDVHGEADFVAGLVAPGARLLDAGCGTGRVAVRLDALGHPVVGVDVDPAMVAVARERAPHLQWHVADLAALDLPGRFAAVVVAGNVVPFVDQESLGPMAHRLAAHLEPQGLVVTGFGLDRAHLPPGAPVVPLTAYDLACEAAGLRLVARHGGWDSTPYAGQGYAVSVHRRTE